MRKILLLFILAGCSKSEPIQSNEIYYYTSFTFWRTGTFASAPQYLNVPIQAVANGRVLNLTSESYRIFPRLKLYLGRYNYETGNLWRSFDGAVGLTLTDDWSNYSDERWQDLSDVRETIAPREELKIKVYTGKIIASDTVFTRLVFVINNREDAQREQVHF